MMFGGNNMGRVGGGVGGGGGNLLRSVGRVVARANLKEPISSSSSSSRHINNNNNTGSFGNNSNSNNNNQVYVSSPFASCNVPSVSTWRRCDEPDWVSVDDSDDFSLGPVPSHDEVHFAVSALQHWVFVHDFYTSRVRDEFGSGLNLNNYDEERLVISPSDYHTSTTSGSESDWIEPSLCMCDSKTLQFTESKTLRVYDALRLLRTEPLVQKMVKSLSSDEAVWNAVLNNEVVRELRESLSSEDIVGKEDSDPESSSNEEMNAVKRIFDGTRAKIMEVVEKITKLVADLFQVPENEKTAKSRDDDGFKEKLRTSFLLSIMVLLVVVVARANKA